MKIDVVRGDITTADAEVIVNAANNEFWMGSGVAGAIKTAGGEIIEIEAMKKGPVMPGNAIYTTAGRLPFKYVIHAAVMGQDLRTTDKLIRQATIAALNLAENLSVASIALPAFGTGIGNFPMAACARIMVMAARGFASHSSKLERVQFFLFDDIGYCHFQKALAAQAVQ